MRYGKSSGGGSQGDDTAANNRHDNNTALASAVIVRREHLDRVHADLNDLAVMSGAELYTREQVTAEIRRIRRYVANLTTSRSGTAS